MDNSRPPRPKAPTHRVYVDESGDHAYTQLDRPGHRFLGLLGVWFEQKTAYPLFVEGLNKIKQDFFGGTPDEPVLLHRKELVARSGCFGVLCDTDTNAKFNAALLRLVEDSAFTMVCVVIDKKRHSEQYVYPFHPYHYSLSCMLERYCRWLNDRGATGDVCAESRGKQPDAELQSAYGQVYENGQGYLKKSMAQRALTSKEIKLRTKAHNIPGLQLADILAHPLKVEALVERGSLKDPGACFGRELAQVAVKKYRKFGTRVNGFGLVWL